tara:strand:- start:2040 stop:2669 length:630 start_codon:yes stop_codon:yes gene_type:complete
MATPSSGTITLNEVHVEAGGSSGSQCSFNDSDIRSICASSVGSQFSMSDMYERAADFSFSGTTGANSQSVSSGYAVITTYTRGLTSSGTSIDSGGTRGSMSPNSDSDYFSNSATIQNELQSIGVAVSKTLVLQNGLANATNSDTACFKSMVIGSTTFNRADATFLTNSSLTQFTWSFAATNDGFSDTTSTVAPFPSPGSTYTGSFRRRT